jgi:hypothetical protein
VADSRCQCPLSSRPSGRRCGEPGPAATSRWAGSTTAGGMPASLTGGGAGR